MNPTRQPVSMLGQRGRFDRPAGDPGGRHGIFFLRSGLVGLDAAQLDEPDDRMSADLISPQWREVVARLLLKPMFGS